MSLPQSKLDRSPTLAPTALIDKVCPQAAQIVPGPVWVARQSHGLRPFGCLRDTPAEEDTTHIRGRATTHDFAGCLAAHRRRVDRSFARDDDVVALRIEADEVEHELRPGHELGAQCCERCAEPARRTCSR